MPLPLPCLAHNPLFDLLIATIGRNEELDRLFTSLEGQSYKNFRILLADQNPAGSVSYTHLTLPTN